MGFVVVAGVIFVRVVGLLVSVFRVFFFPLLMASRRLFRSSGPLVGQPTDSTARAITVGRLFIPCLLFVDVMACGILLPETAKGGGQGFFK